jgi:hypothetical protein
MTQTIDNQLIFEVLKKIQTDVTHIKERVSDHDQKFIAIHEQILNLERAVLRVAHENGGKLEA